MTVTNGYCTVANLREQLNDAVAQKLSLEILERAINATSRAIDDWCGRKFWRDAEPSARTYRARDLDVLWTHDFSTLDGLVVETGRSGSTWSTTWAASDYDVIEHPRNADNAAKAWTGLIPADDGVQSLPLDGRGANVRVTARWGWAAVPPEVEQATVLRATAIFNRKDAVHGVAGFGDFGPVRIAKRDVDVIALLDPYQRIRTPDTP